MIMAQHEFLPLCDVLFNIISLVAYFCDIVFDALFGYALLAHSKEYTWGSVVIILVIFASVIQQIMSASWYWDTIKKKAIKDGDDKLNVDSVNPIIDVKTGSVILVHLVQLGVFWRYCKLFIPVDLRFVKYEVRDLCMLRLVHAFCQSMPLLIIQLYLYSEGRYDSFKDLNTVAIAFSLFSVCWALASFSKNVRAHNVHRLVLTWLGVILQFFWRLGTVGARAVSLVAYAHLFQFWIFLVILLHWFSMFLWVLSPKNVFHGERMPCSRKVLLCSVVAFVYTFAYINLIEVNHREKMMLFYVVMGLENAMLMFVWVLGVSTSDETKWYRIVLPLCVFTMFMAGLGFMWMYYQYFHVRRLKYETGGRFNYNNNNSIAATDNHKFSDPVIVQVDKVGDHPYADKDLIRRHSFSGGYLNLNDLVTYSRIKNESSMSGDENKALQKIRNGMQPIANGNLGGIPGVFNCRFSNPYVTAMQKRKRKKPTSFVPPPSITQSGHPDNISTEVAQPNELSLVPNNGYNSVPFWYRPLSELNQSCSDNDCGSIGSRSAVQPKFAKKKQIDELKKIEDVLRMRKLLDNSNIANRSPSHEILAQHYDSPEILLAPRYLNPVGNADRQYYGYNEIDAAVYGMLNEESLAQIYKMYRGVPSDLDSQLSLPRSYTLPREFKFYRKSKLRKPIRTEHFVASTNSSDGDVDSGDDSDSGRSHLTSTQGHVKRLPTSTLKKSTMRVRHETQL